MATGEFKSQTITTTTTTITTTIIADRQPTLVLRHRLTRVRDEVVSALQKGFESLKKSLGNKSASDLTKLVDSKCENFKKEFTLKVDGVKAEVQSYAPTKPTEDNFKSNAEFQKALEQYEEELEAYRTLVALYGYILEKFGEIFSDFLETFKITLQDLWSEMRKDRSKINSLQLANVYSGMEKNFLKEIDDLFGMMPQK